MKGVECKLGELSWYYSNFMKRALLSIAYILSDSIQAKFAHFKDIYISSPQLRHTLSMNFV